MVVEVWAGGATVGPLVVVLGSVPIVVDGWCVVGAVVALPMMVEVSSAVVVG
jgi:hypothetical protein